MARRRLRSGAFQRPSMFDEAARRGFVTIKPEMLSDFAPILVFLAVCVAFGAGVQALSSWLGPRRPSAAKDLPYECGIVPVETARRRFSVSFYVTAMLFIIFDVESIFLLPWATIVRQLKIFGIVEMGIFIATLLIGLVYVWAKGALRWD